MATKPPKKPLAPLASRVKSDPALLARALRDPGLRSKLPDQYLSATQLAGRKRNQYLGDLGDIGSPLSGQSLVNAAQQTVDSDYAPLLADVGNKENIVNKSAGTQGNWAKRYYGELNSLLGSIGGAQATANQNAVQGAVAAGATAHGAVTAADQAAQQTLAQDAAVRGADLQGDAVPNQAARTAAAQGVVTNNAQAAQTAAQNYGDVQSAFLRGLQGAAAQQGGEYQQQITGQQGQLLNQLGETRKDLALKKAGAFTDTLLKLRGGEQTNAITQAGLLNKEQQAALSANSQAASLAQRAKEAAARNRLTANQQALTARGQDLSHADRQASIKARGKGSKKGSGSSKDGGATNVQVGQAQDGTTGALSDARTLIKTVGKDRHKLAAALLNGQPESASTVNQKTKDGSVSTKVIRTPAIDKHDPLYTSVALDVLLDGHVSRYNARRLHSRGLTVEDLGFPSYSDSQKSGGKAKLSPSERAPGGT